MSLIFVMYEQVKEMKRKTGLQISGEDGLRDGERGARARDREEGTKAGNTAPGSGGPLATRSCGEGRSCRRFRQDVPFVTSYFFCLSFHRL